VSLDLRLELDGAGRARRLSVYDGDRHLGEIGAAKLELLAYEAVANPKPRLRIEVASRHFTVEVIAHECVALVGSERA
jgi:hypothetical protein